MKSNPYNPIQILFMIVFGCLITSCSGIQNQPNARNGSITVDFHFEEQNMCNGISPRITLGNVPPGAKQFRISLKDIDNPVFNHGGGIVQSDNTNIINAGALDSYYGPCPPKDFLGQYKYCFKVEALDSVGRIISWGRNCKLCGWSNMGK